MIVQGPSSLSNVLSALINLHSLRRLEADQGWLLTEGVISLEAARAIPAEIRYCPRDTHATLSCTCPFIISTTLNPMVLCCAVCSVEATMYLV